MYYFRYCAALCIEKREEKKENFIVSHSVVRCDISNYISAALEKQWQSIKRQSQPNRTKIKKSTSMMTTTIKIIMIINKREVRWK